MATIKLLKDAVIPDLVYAPHVKRRIDGMVKGCPIECFWMGVVSRFTDGSYYLEDIFVPHQKATAVTVNVEDTAMAEVLTQAIAAGYGPEDILYWGHSHVNMGVTPSGTDDAQAEDFLEDFPQLIRAIYNKSGQSRVDIFDKESGILYEDVDDFVEEKNSDEDDAFIKEHLARVERQVYKAPATNWKRPSIPQTGNKKDTSLLPLDTWDYSDVNSGYGGGYAGYNGYNSSYEDK